MQVYKEFSILSSRPSKIDEKKLKHHLYGILSVKKYFSVGQWIVLAKQKVNLCIKNKKTPIFVGGTGLYFNAITRGISKIPQIDNKIRKEVRNLQKEMGQETFYKKLVLLDPKSEKKILPTDTHRSLRAYEVKLSTKKSLYDWATDTKSEFLDFDIKKIFIDTPRDVLIRNIEKRTNQMFKEKCVNEVKNFHKLNIDKTLSSNKIIGVKEISDYLLGSISEKEALELINIKTRQYAKRQNTWSRGHMTSWNKLYSKDFSILLKKVLKAIS
jgi:tRNA dimethylallyltransferase